MRVEQVLSDVRTLVPWDFKTLLIASVGLVCASPRTTTLALTVGTVCSDDLMGSRI